MLKKYFITFLAGETIGGILIFAYSHDEAEKLFGELFPKAMFLSLEEVDA